MPGLGVPFIPRSRAALRAAATPPSGNAQENIWHQYYSSVAYVSATTLEQTFFSAPSADPTLSNFPQGGVFPQDQQMQLYNICLDILSNVTANSQVVSSTTDNTGLLDDLAQLLFGASQRPVWTLNISEKKYGPYSLTVLRGTGGPVGFGWSSDGTNLFQFAKNDPAEGWNYHGTVVVVGGQLFNLQVRYAGAATLTADALCRASVFGVLGRRVQ